MSKGSAILPTPDQEYSELKVNFDARSPHIHELLLPNNFVQKGRLAATFALHERT